MPEIILTTGYSGHKPEDLKRIAERMDAVIVDIRFTPFSRWHPEWRKPNLEALLGDWYVSVREWGNRNHGGNGPIEIADFAGGWAVVGRISRPVIAICTCKDAEMCHRSVVGSMVVSQGLCVVKELDWVADRKELSLF
jgi:hypothetical protein